MKITDQITAEIIFYYKGEKIAASVLLDLENVFSTQSELPDLYSLLAKSIGLSLYSYEYEIMQSENIQFSHATGLAEQYLTDGKFDQQGFRQARLKQKAIFELSNIAKKHLQIEDLEKQPMLKHALLDAYYLGKNSA